MILSVKTEKLEPLKNCSRSFPRETEQGVKKFGQPHRTSTTTSDRTRLTGVIPKAILRPWPIAKSEVVVWALFVESTETTFRRSRATQLAEQRVGRSRAKNWCEIINSTHGHVSNLPTSQADFS